MIAVFDTNYLVLLMQGSSPDVVHDPEYDTPVERVPEKLSFLLTELKKKRAKILIPTPVLAELFAGLGNKANEIFEVLNNSYGMQFADFNVAAAIETGLALRTKKKTDRRTGWQKVKFDRQIVSIAKVNKAEIVYSNDMQVCRWSRNAGMKSVSIWQLENPPPTQIPLSYTELCEKVEGEDPR